MKPKEAAQKETRSLRELYAAAIEVAWKLAGYSDEDRQIIISKVADLLTVLPCLDEPKKER
jgi:hypothetical protein